MGDQDRTYARVGIHKRSTLRSMCRNLLSEHIANTLGIHVKPCEVRLKIDDENTQYTWHVQDPKIQELFEKQLSKHSVGAYVTLTDEVGRSFWAIHRHSANESLPCPPLKFQLESLQEENARLAQKVEFLERDVDSSRRAKEVIEREIFSLNENLKNSYGTIATTQQEVHKWMSLAEYYQKNFSQWLDGINHVSQILQSLAVNVPDIRSLCGDVPNTGVY